MGDTLHSVLVTPYADRTATTSYPLAFRGASSPDPTTGIGPGKTQTFAFVAGKVGTYALVCAVPGHEAAGMWDTLKVARGGTASITIAH